MLVKAIKDMAVLPSQNQVTELGGQSADILSLLLISFLGDSVLWLSVLWKWH